MRYFLLCVLWFFCCSCVCNTEKKSISYWYEAKRKYRWCVHAFHWLHDAVKKKKKIPKKIIFSPFFLKSLCDTGLYFFFVYVCVCCVVLKKVSSICQQLWWIVESVGQSPWELVVSELSGKAKEGRSWSLRNVEKKRKTWHSLFCYATTLLGGNRPQNG